METVVEPFWSSSCLPALPAFQWSLQCRLRKESWLRLHGSLSRSGSRLHQSSDGARQCGGRREFFQTRTRPLYGCMDSPSHPRRPCVSLYHGFRGSEGGLSMDLLDFGHCNTYYQVVTVETPADTYQVNAVQFVLYLFFGPETRYVATTSDPRRSGFRQEFLTFRRIDPTPLRVWEFLQPLSMAMRATVMIPAAAYAMVFLFGSVLMTVEIPQLLQEKFALSTQGLGLQFLSLIIGSVLGEQAGGSLSDSWMNSHARRTHQRPAPEYRLWLSYSGFILMIVGVVVFLVQTQNEPAGRWNVTPIVGVAIAAFGNQVVTTVLITYAVDCNQGEAASVGVFITFVRQIWGFIGPFW